MKRNLLAQIVVCTLLFFAVDALAQTPQPFSADYSATSSNGNANVKGKFYFSIPKMRLDMTDNGHQQNAGPFSGPISIIFNGETKTAYMLLIERHMYVEFPAGNAAMMQRMPKVQDFNGNPCSVQEGATCKKVGTETIDGRLCDKWEETEKNDMRETLWIDQKLHFPIKTQFSDGTISEFTNIQEGAQGAALFQVPADYKKGDIGYGGHRH